MKLKPLNPDDIWKMLDGHEDILRAEKEKDDAFYRQCVCPKCGSGCERQMTANHMFAHGGPLPRATLKCLKCSYHYDPHSGITVELGDWKLNS